MSQQITTAFVRQFTAGIRLLQQQMGSNLREGVMVDNDVVGDRAFYDQVDATSMAAITDRHGDTTITDTPHARRQVVLNPFEVADLVDRKDKIRVLNDPTNAYTQSFAMAAGRQIDDIIIAQFLASADTGVSGGTPVAHPGGNFQIASSVGITTGMNLTKILTAREVLEAAENVEDDGNNQWFMVLSARQRRDLLATTEVTSVDYNSVRALVNGQIDTFLGFKFLKSERLGVAATERQVIAWSKKSMQLAVGQEPRGFIDVLPGKRHSTQVRYELDAGATRMDENGVIEILCAEA